MENRRDLLKKAMVGLVAIPVVSSVTEVTTETKAVILTLRPDVQCDDLDNLKQKVKQVLRKAGCERMEVIVTDGIDVQVVS